MADAELTLYYFDGKGRAEVARLILIGAGKEFTDIRFSPENWPEYKILAPFGQCPFIKVDNKIFSQSLAINSFLAREFGFHGETNLESLEIDQITQLVEDLVCICLDAIHLDDREEKNKEIEKIRVNKSPTFLNNFEKLLKENSTGYFVGDRLTLADLAVFDVITGMLENYVDVNDTYPLLLKNVELVKAHSKIGPYVASRPITEF